MKKPPTLTQSGIAHRFDEGCDRQESAPVEIPIEPHSALDVYHHPRACEGVGSVEHCDGRFAV